MHRSSTDENNQWSQVKVNVKQVKEDQWTQYLSESLADGEARSRRSSVTPANVSKKGPGYLKVAGDGSRAGSFTTTICDEVAADPSRASAVSVASTEVIREEDQVGVVVPTYDIAGDGMPDSDTDDEDRKSRVSDQTTSDKSIEL